MLRTLAVIGAVVLALVVLNYRAPQDPVRQIDPAPTAAQVAQAAPFDVLLPTDPGWRATAARWEPTAASQGERVWFVGGVYGSGSPFASVSQSRATNEEFIAERTRDGAPVGASRIAGAEWERYQAGRTERSLVLRTGDGVTVVSGTADFEALERFAASLRPVGP